MRSLAEDHDWPFMRLHRTRLHCTRLVSQRAASLPVVGIFTCINPVAVDIYCLSELVNCCRVALMAHVAFYLSHLQGCQRASIVRLSRFR